MGKPLGERANHVAYRLVVTVIFYTDMTNLLGQFLAQMRGIPLLHRKYNSQGHNTEQRVLYGDQIHYEERISTRINTRINTHKNLGKLPARGSYRTCDHGLTASSLNYSVTLFNRRRWRRLAALTLT